MQSYVESVHRLVAPGFAALTQDGHRLRWYKRDAPLLLAANPPATIRHPLAGSGLGRHGALSVMLSAPVLHRVHGSRDRAIRAPGRSGGQFARSSSCIPRLHSP